MRSLILASVLTTLTACGPKAGGTYEVATATTDAAAATSIKAEADSLWEKRGDKASLEASLAKYEQAHASDPTDREVVVKLTRGYYFLGDAHESEMEAKMAQWDKSVAWGKKCMAFNSDFTAILEKGDEDEATATRATTKADVPCMYWMATSLGKWAKANGIAKSLKYLPTVKAFIGKVSELDPTYFHAASDRYWGAYYSVVPSFAGQDLDKSKSHFDKSIAAAPAYFGTKVLMAENLAVKLQDTEMFDKLLAEVVSGDANAVAEIAPENTVEQAKARALQEKKSDLFR